MSSFATPLIDRRQFTNIAVINSGPVNTKIYPKLAMECNKRETRNAFLYPHLLIIMPENKLVKRPDIS